MPLWIQGLFFRPRLKFASTMRRSGFLSPRGVVSTGLETLAGQPAIRCPCAQVHRGDSRSVIHERLLPREALRAVKNMTSFHCHCVLGRPTDHLTPSFSPNAARRSAAPRPCETGRVDRPLRVGTGRPAQSLISAQAVRGSLPRNRSKPLRRGTSRARRFKMRSFNVVSFPRKRESRAPARAAKSGCPLSRA